MRAKVIKIGKASAHYSERKALEGKIGEFKVEAWLDDSTLKAYVKAESKDFPEGAGNFYCCDIQIKRIPAQRPNKTKEEK